MMLTDLAQYLEENGVAVLGKDLFLGAMPEEPDDCVGLFEYQGQAPNQQAGTQTPGLQVVSRAKHNYMLAEGRLRQMHEALGTIGFEEGAQKEGIVIEDTHYLRVTPVMSGAQPLGMDENGCVRLARNYYVVLCNAAQD